MTGAEVFDSVALGVASSAICWAARETGVAARKIRQALDDVEVTRRYTADLTEQLGTYSRERHWGSLERFLRNQSPSKGATR